MKNEWFIERDTLILKGDEPLCSIPHLDIRYDVDDDDDDTQTNNKYATYAEVIKRR